MTVSDFPTVPFDGAHRLRRSGMTGRSDAEVQAPADEQVRRLPQPERKRVNGRRKYSVKHDARMLYLSRPSERDRHIPVIPGDDLVRFVP